MTTNLKYPEIQPSNHYHCRKLPLFAHRRCSGRYDRSDSGYAINPDKNTAANVFSILYEGYYCTQLREETARLSSKALEIMVVQTSKGGGTTTTEVAHLKGQMNAVEEASIKHKCNIQFQKEPAKVTS